jgi:hypothetical protein
MVLKCLLNEGCFPDDPDAGWKRRDRMVELPFGNILLRETKMDSVSLFPFSRIITLFISW